MTQTLQTRHAGIKRWSESFLFTYHPTDWNDNAKLAETKAAVAQHNAINPDKQQYVKLQGRLGVNNPNAHLYQTGRVNYQQIRKAHAAYFDVYVYNK